MTLTVRKEIHYVDRLVDCFEPRPRSIEAMVAVHVQDRGDAIAIVDGKRQLSYRQLNDQAARLAGALRAKGLERGDRVAMILENRIEFVLVLLACAKLGAIAVPMGTRLRRPEIEYICQNSGARVLIHETALTGQVPDRDQIENINLILDVGDDASGSFSAFQEGGDPVEPVALHEDDPLCIMYTSGTTGRPKGAVISHFGFVHSCLHWVDRLHLPAGVSTVLVIPASHISGLGGVIMPFLQIGGRIILMRNFKAAVFLETMAQTEAEHALLVPAMYNLCLRQPEFVSVDLSKWRWAIYGGAPMPEPTIKRFAELLPDLQMCNAYGATETTSPVTIMHPGDGVRRSESIGHVVRCGDVRILDEDGKEVPKGASGELFIAGPMVVAGYWQNEAANAASFVSGYWRSGDIGSIDADGFVQIFDRKKDMINRGGYKVYPAEVENVLADHPAIVEVAVIGIADEVLGERVVAFTQTNADIDVTAVREFCGDRLADYKHPDFVFSEKSPLPRNANGKLQKDVLRQRLKELLPS